MPPFRQLEFFLLRYVPDAVKDEFVNIGVVMTEPAANGSGFADVRFTRDWRRVRCLDPAADIEMLEAVEAELRRRLSDGLDREQLLNRLRDSFSNAIQLSPAKACLAESPQAEIEKLAGLYLETTRRRGAREAGGRRLIVQRMRHEFEQAGVWPHMRHNIAVAQYTHKGDPLRLDCGYRPNGVVKLYHGVALESEVDGARIDAAKALAFSFPAIREGIATAEKAGAELAAIVEDSLDRADDAIAFALATLEQSGIRVAPMSELPRIAEAARLELRL